jgi:hypothetical protein
VLAFLAVDVIVQQGKPTAACRKAKRKNDKGKKLNAIQGFNPFKTCLAVKCNLIAAESHEMVPIIKIDTATEAPDEVYRAAAIGAITPMVTQDVGARSKAFARSLVRSLWMRVMGQKGGFRESDNQSIP